jgi:hypothetical protein
MKSKRKYQGSRSASGWGIWDAITGTKVMSCYSRIDMLEKWFELEGWSKPAKWN